ncbi:hypothetical protein CNMCM5793_006839 [Aspergillus hiratsukae]|uniref:Uncharacterized protein n=1 Tax=Aspergillus hiratsukae TaxID=1194566 RepID=A0A8H6QIP5_9EURO|nr:hypothetical protein CNMCM5793_006839 [Aspergillus hiratsukae]KAF7174330.1 hypothetical protein CNMCM6106_008551 [Aspergillus hiratsukae]
MPADADPCYYISIKKSVLPVSHSRQPAHSMLAQEPASSQFVASPMTETKLSRKACKLGQEGPPEPDEDILEKPRLLWTKT